RRMFVGLSGLLAIVMACSLQLAWPLWSAWLMLGLTYVGFVGIMRQDLRGWGWVLSPVVLLMSVLAAFVWMRLYMGSTLANMVGSLGFGLGIYGLMLTLNIMQISTLRSLPLARTASSVLS